MDNNSEFTYLKEDIIFFQYPNGGDLSFDKGEIKSIVNNFKIIGIHKEGNKNKEDNLGTFMKNISNDNLNNYIIYEYYIKKDKLKQSIQILNSYEEVKRKHPKE